MRRLDNIPDSMDMYCVLSLQSCPILVNPQTAACQPLLSIGFSRQENWSGLPFPSPGDVPNPGIKSVCLASPALVGRFFTLLWHKNRQIGQWTRTESLEISPCVYSQLIFDIGAKAIQSAKNSLSSKWYQDDCMITYKRMKLDPYLTPNTKINLK